MAVVKANTDTRVCTNHPDRETLVSCGRCLRPFCPACLIHTPAGQRCYECAGVRRDYRQRAARALFMRGFGVLFLGSLISGLIGPVSLFGLIIAGATGNYAGQALSPTVTRHTRPWVYAPLLLVVFFGTWLGWSLGVTARGMISITARGAFWNPISLIQVPISALFATPFWIVLLIVAVVVFLRAR